MVRYTIVFLSSKRFTLIGVLLLLSIALRRLEPAPSAPITNEDSSTHSLGVLLLGASLLLLLLLAVALMSLVVLPVLLLLPACCWKVSLHTCRHQARRRVADNGSV
jgi:hypothetical protein